MGTISRVAVVLIAAALGGATGLLIGWALRAFAVRFGEENVWVVSVIAGAASGAAAATTVIGLRDRIR
jgi:hypothetical protein